MVELSEIIKKYGAFIVSLAALIMGNWNTNFLYVSLGALIFGLGYFIRSLEAKANKKPPKQIHQEKGKYVNHHIEYPYTIKYFDDGSSEVLLGNPKCSIWHGDIIIQERDGLELYCEECDSDVQPGKISYQEHEERMKRFILQKAKGLPKAKK